MVHTAKRGTSPALVVPSRLAMAVCPYVCKGARTCRSSPACIALSLMWQSFIGARGDVGHMKVC